MNFLPPLVRQLLVASSAQLAALSVGGLMGYPAVLLHQLKRNDSSIVLDLDTSSWIASIHGLAGIPSVLILIIMQKHGRRFAFFAACLCTLVGWILTYYAIDATTVLIGETFHGLGGNSLNAVNLVIINEMVDPKLRSTSLVLLNFTQALGMTVITFAGFFLQWQTVSIVLGIPTLVDLLSTFIWPESPSWLASKGKLKESEKALFLLRGTGNEVTKELSELMRTQKESLREIILQKSLYSSNLQSVGFSCFRKEFIVPFMYIVLVMFTFYFSGSLVIFIYAIDIIASSTNNSNFISFIYIDVIVIIASILNIILLRYFKEKSVLIASLVGTGFFLVSSSVFIYFKDSDVISKHALFISVLGCIFCCMFGSFNLTFSMSAELIPLKHKKLGDAMFIIVSCIFHSLSLKMSPYLFKSLGISGTLMIFAIVNLCGLFLILKFVPETKGNNLQEINNFYSIDFENLNEEKIDDEFEMTVVNDDFIE